MNVSIDDVVFLDDNHIVYSEGVDEYWEDYKKGINIPPIDIIFQQEGIFYAGHGRHRTYMFYHRVGLREMEVNIVKDYVLNSTHKYALEHGCVSIKDLVENSFDE